MNTACLEKKRKLKNLVLATVFLSSQDRVKSELTARE